MVGEHLFWQRVRCMARIARGKEADVDLVLSMMLRGAVRGSILVVLLGLLIVALASPQNTPASVDLDSLPSGLTQLQGPAIMGLGILLLISVPIASVFFSLVLLARVGDMTSTAMAGLVLVILTVSLLLGVTA